MSTSTGFRAPVQPTRPAAPTSRRAGQALLASTASVVFCWTGVVVVIAVLGIVWSVRARRDPAASRSMLLAALLLGIAGLLLSLLGAGLITLTVLRHG